MSRIDLSILQHHLFDFLPNYFIIKTPKLFNIYRFKDNDTFSLLLFTTIIVLQIMMTYDDFL